MNCRRVCAAILAAVSLAGHQHHHDAAEQVDRLDPRRGTGAVATITSTATFAL